MIRSACHWWAGLLPVARFLPKNILRRITVSIPRFSIPNRITCCGVHGMSMRDAGILDGDLVAVHRTPEVRSRQIIVARIDDEVTVKRYQQKGSMVELLPENEDFETIHVISLSRRWLSRALSSVLSAMACHCTKRL